MEEVVIERGLIYIICCIIVYCAFRRFVYSLMDPLTITLLILPSSIALSVGRDMLWYVVISSFALWLGFRVSTNVPINRVAYKRKIHPYRYNVGILRTFTYIFFLITLLSSIMTFMQLGVPLLSDNPSEAKVAGFEGLGILRRISFISNIVPIGLLILIACSKKKNAMRMDLFLLFIYIVVTILKGSKSSVLHFLILLYFFLKVSPIGRSFYQEYRKVLVHSFVVSVIFMAWLLIYIVSKEATREGGDVAISLSYRLMEFGEVMIYYSDRAVQSYCSHAYSWTHFIQDELNEVLGMLKIASYNTPIGFNMVSAFWGGKENDVITGPNTVFFVKGHIYFGYIGGLLYSFFVGCFTAKIRLWYLRYNSSDVFKYAIASFVFFNFTTFLRESCMFFGMLFTFLIIGYIVYIVSSLIIYSKYNGRKTHISNYGSMECT